MAVTNEVQLKVDHIFMAFGGVQALMDISLSVKKG
jgi:ABC-type branched-subunit amino acid transport system ATPase component